MSKSLKLGLVLGSEATAPRRAGAAASSFLPLVGLGFWLPRLKELVLGGRGLDDGRGVLLHGRGKRIFRFLDSGAIFLAQLDHLLRGRVDFVPQVRGFPLNRGEFLGPPLQVGFRDFKLLSEIGIFLFQGADAFGGVFACFVGPALGVGQSGLSLDRPGPLATT